MDNNNIDLRTFNRGVYPKTLKELKAWSEDDEQVLIDMIDEAKLSHVTNDLKFKDVFNVDYTYKTLLKNIRNRGWYTRWAKKANKY